MCESQIDETDSGEHELAGPCECICCFNVDLCETA